MIRRFIPSPLWTLGLACLWLLLARWITPGAVVMAALAGIGIPLLLGERLPRARLSRPLLLLPYALVLLADIVVSSLTVARIVVFGKMAELQPAWIVIPSELDQPAAVALLAGTITLTPGTLSADVATDGRTILVHCLHAPDPEAVVDTIRARYEARLKRIWGMIVKLVVLFAIGCFLVALMLNLWRFWVGPADSDRILALDTMTMNIVALLVLVGIGEESRMFVDAAMLLALFGFIASVAFARARRGQGPLE